MTSATLARTIRRPLAWLVVLAAMLLTLLMLETTGRTHAPSIVPITTVANNSAAHGTSHGNTSHCTDGHGKDGQKNPHCRGISHG